mmetsp:Transcript_28081/g.65922  ORF Transcript_28081/g.65922 Transcript_28081/m.65922 type:complete len:251 (-) Transcript_28081:2474-3226(-)
MLLYCGPFTRNCHEVAFHRICETSLVQRWLNNSWSFATYHHRQRFPNTFHLFQDVILSHKIDNAYHQFHFFLVNTHQYRVIKDVDDGEKQCVIQNTHVENFLGSVMHWHRTTKCCLQKVSIQKCARRIRSLLFGDPAVVFSISSMGEIIGCTSTNIVSRFRRILSLPAWRVGTMPAHTVRIVVIGMVVVIVFDLSCKSTSKRAFEVKCFRDFLVIKYVLHNSNLLHTSLASYSIVISDLINPNNLAKDSR